MRVASIIGLLAVIAPLATAWSKEDREIFRVRDELIAHEGANVTFYDFLGVKTSASQEEIGKAYKKKSRSLHPDKVKQQLAAERAQAAKSQTSNKGGKPDSTARKGPSQSEIKTAVKLASDRQTRLSLIAKVLRGSGRERYDHFLSNGFPVWKGTEYYYQRYRPGLGTVIVGLFLFAGGGAHYLALYMSWKRQREFVERYIKYARQAAWGENLTVPGVDARASAAPSPSAAEQQQAGGDERPMAVNRKQRRWQEKEAKRESATDTIKKGSRKTRATVAASGTASPVSGVSDGPQGAKKRVVAQNGKVLVVDSLGDVYLEQDDDEGNMQEFLLDPDSLLRPTISDTALVRMPIFAYKQSIGRLLGQRHAGIAELDGTSSAGVEAETDSDNGKPTPSTGSADDDFELLDKSIDDLGIAKTTGTQTPQASKSRKSKSKKR